MQPIDRSLTETTRLSHVDPGDTIAALASASGPAARAIIRLSGPKAACNRAHGLFGEPECGIGAGFELIRHDAAGHANGRWAAVSDAGDGGSVARPAVVHCAGCCRDPFDRLDAACEPGVIPLLCSGRAVRSPGSSPCVRSFPAASTSRARRRCWGSSTRRFHAARARLWSSLPAGFRTRSRACATGFWTWLPISKPTLISARSPTWTRSHARRSPASLSNQPRL